MSLSKKIRAGSRAGLKMAGEGRERILAWGLYGGEELRLGQEGSHSHGHGFRGLDFTPVPRGFLSLLRCGAERKKVMVTLKSCQQSNMKKTESDSFLQSVSQSLPQLDPGNTHCPSSTALKWRSLMEGKPEWKRLKSLKQLQSKYLSR